MTIITFTVFGNEDSRQYNTKHDDKKVLDKLYFRALSKSSDIYVCRKTNVYAILNFFVKITTMKAT